jgi:pyruvate,orthophosphate dikinase
MAKDIIFLHKHARPEITTDNYGYLAGTISKTLEAGIPSLPIMAIHTDTAKILHEKYPEKDLTKHIETYNEKLANIKKTEFEAETPTLLNLHVNPCLELNESFVIRNIGIANENIKNLSESIGFKKIKANFLELLAAILHLEIYNPKLFEINETPLTIIDSDINNKLNDIKETQLTFFNKIKKSKSVDHIETAINELKKNDIEIYQKYFKSVLQQIKSLLKKTCSLIAKHEELAAVSLMPVPDSYFTDPSEYGNCFTHNLLTGDPALSGKSAAAYPDFLSLLKEDNEPFSKQTEKHLNDPALKIRNAFKNICIFSFVIFKDTAYVLSVEPVIDTSFQTNLKMRLNLHKDKKITDADIIKDITSTSLLELLHPIIDKKKAKTLKPLTGGILGSFGAAVGKVFFSAEKLISEYEKANTREENTDFILAMPATFANEVRAIKIANGVISSEGGFSSHAPVVSRSLNKVSLVNNNIEFGKDFFKLGGKTIKEGDEITINCIYGKPPEIYLEKIPLISPDFKTNGITELLTILNKYNKKTCVYANADQKPEAENALRFGAEGIGLCRTEHMFFHKDRLMPFVEMIFLEEQKEREKILKKIEKFQVDDFTQLLKTFKDKPVTIRLLDAPLHEFLPKSKKDMTALISYLTKKHKNMTEESIRLRCDVMNEFNPMLGHRGLRIAVSHPEIYHMQVRAILRAACKLAKEKITCYPKIMIPMVMSINELQFIRNGKIIEGKKIPGIIDIAEEVLKEEKEEGKISYSVGSMVEIPSASLITDDLARYSEFFSFGTNDLTQTTLGLSRDDSTLFLGDYDKYELVNGNPFSILQPGVKKMIETGIRKAKMVRPDVILSICGEHGASPENVTFLTEQGVDIISCSSFSIPLVKFEIAKSELA